MLKPYPGATNQILVAGQSQPALYGPMRAGFIYNPRTIQDQGIDPFTASIVQTSAVFLGQFASTAFLWTGYEATGTTPLNALAMAGFAEIATFVEEVSYGPPEVLYVSLIPPAGSAQNGTTEVILPGQLWRAPECYCGSVYVRAATKGHRFTSVVFQDQTQYPPAPVPGNFPPAGPVTMLNVLLAYLYKQYEDDNDLQGFVQAYNVYAQLFIDWFNQINLPIYTGLSGALLDWIGQGLYGIRRPTLFSNVPAADGPFATVAFAVEPFTTLDIQNNITNVAVTSDDVYKRIVTWHFYKGDGKNLSTTWLRRRITRFMFGANGTDFQGPFPNLSVQWTANQLTITIVSDWAVCSYPGTWACGSFADAPFCGLSALDAPQSVPALAPIFKEAVDTSALETPIQYSTTVRIGPKGAFGNFAVSYSRSALT